MNPILKDTLVWKYFGCRHTDDSQVRNSLRCEEEVALRVLDAMTAPIKDGERYLYLGYSGDVRERRCVVVENVALHGTMLRLPDQFQEPDYEKELAEYRETVTWKNYCPERVDGLIDLARKAERQKTEREKASR